MYACMIHDVPFAQVRAVSNLVERRNRARPGGWPKAIDRLGGVTLQASRDRYETYPRRLPLSERLLHLRRHRQPADRPRSRSSSSLHLADVEALNRAAFAGEADITKLSYHAYAYCADRYVALDAGSALGQELRTAADFEAAHRTGRSCGGRPEDCDSRQVHHRQFSSRLCVPSGAQQDGAGVLGNRVGACSTGEYDAGLIIHENRFTYQAQGTEEDSRSRRTLGDVSPARRFRSAASSSGARCRTR